MVSSLLKQTQPFTLHNADGLELGMESIQYQGRQLFTRLTTAVARLRNFNPETRKRFSTQDVVDAELSKIVKEEIGFNCTFYIKPTMSPNAGMFSALLDKNHPFFDEMTRNHRVYSTAGTVAISLLGEKARGSVDLRNSRVTGIFAEIPLDSYITYGLLADRSITNEEIAATILHELGHAFTHCYYLGHVVTSNLLISHAARRMVGEDDAGERVKILREAERYLGIEIPKVDTLAETPPTDLQSKVETVLINAHRTRYRSITGTDLYDLRACEQMADHFAVMHGSGSKVITDLYKLYKRYGHNSMESLGMYLIGEITKATIGLAFLPLTFLFIITANPCIDIYDRPLDRVKFVRKNMNDILKKRDLPKSEKEYLLKEIEIVKQVEAEMNSRVSWFQSLANVFSMNVRGYNRQVDNEKLLEDLVFNDLYAKSAELSLLKGT